MRSIADNVVTNKRLCPIAPRDKEIGHEAAGVSAPTSSERGVVYL